MEKESDITLAMHPETLHLLMWSSARDGGYDQRYGDYRRSKVFGYRINIDYCLRPAKVVEAKWVFPADPFITYEPKDEDWCRYFGYGHQQNRKIDTGEVVLRRDLPIYAFDHEACQWPRWASSSKYVDRVGYDCFTDMDYIRAVQAVDRIHKMIDSYLRWKLDQHNELFA
jgi:hypothetical protein